MLYLPIIIVFISFILDQLTKILVVNNMYLWRDSRESIDVIGNFLRLKYIENKGMMWGMFSDVDQSVKDIVFTSLTILAVGVVIYYYRSINRSKIVLKSAFALILGGALGNLADKTLGYIIFEGKLQIFNENGNLYGRVVDFLDVGINQTRWPTFNVADITITVGVFIIFYFALFKKEDDFFTTSKEEN